MIKKVFLKIDRTVEWLGDYGLIVSGILILFMSLAATYGVGRRYIFNNPEPYSYEISTMLLVACVVLSVAGLQRHLRHLRVDFFASRFPASVQNALIYIFTPLLALTFVVIITWQSWDNALYSFRIGETSQSSWQEPLWPSKMLVPIGYAFLVLVLLTQLTRGFVMLGQALRKKENKPVTLP